MRPFYPIRRRAIRVRTKGVPTSIANAGSNSANVLDSGMTKAFETANTFSTVPEL